MLHLTVAQLSQLWLSELLQVNCGWNMTQNLERPQLGQLCDTRSELGVNLPSVSAITMAVKLGGKGDVSESHVVWRIQRGAPSTPTPLLVGDELYFVNDKGIASCVDAKTT